MTEQYTELINKLIEATKDKRIDWQLSINKDEYKTNVGGNSISIKEHVYDPYAIFSDFDKETYAIMSISNISGKEIDSVKGSKESSPSDYKTLSNLYEIAKRSYNKVDETLDNILKELDK